jgi:FKBP-type peptidyl-prolyl cis-trans isomerase (trigger factor)
MKTIASEELKQQKNKTFTLTVNLEKENINHEYDHLLQHAQAEFESKGFRKGKAPIEYVKSQLSEAQVIEEIISHLLSHIYEEKIKQYQLKPIIQPQIKVLNPPLTLDKDWQVEIIGCELPEIKLDPQYSDQVKKINLSKENDEEKLNQTIEILIKNSTVDVPDILIQADIENKLSQLVDQTKEAGLTVSQYLKNRHQTLEEHRQELATKIKSEWITNLAIDAIAKDQKIEIKETEVKEITDKNPSLQSNISLVYYLLTQRKVFDYLKNIS